MRNTYDFVLRSGDTSPSIQRQMTDDDGRPIDLTQASVRFIMTPQYDSTPVIDAAATVVSDSAAGIAPTDGVVRYDWGPTDTAAAGPYRAEFEVTFPTGRVETFPSATTLWIRVRDDLGGTV